MSLAGSLNAEFLGEKVCGGLLRVVELLVASVCFGVENVGVGLPGWRLDLFLEFLILLDLLLRHDYFDCPE